MQKIYLSRHGEVFNNVMFDIFPNYPDLIPRANTFLEKTSASPDWKKAQKELLDKNCITDELLMLFTGITKEAIVEKTKVKGPILNLDSLTENGKSQAKRLGKYFYNNNINPDTAIYITSTKSRTAETLTLATEDHFPVEHKAYPEFDEVRPLDLILEKMFFTNPQCPEYVVNMIKSKTLDEWREYLKTQPKDAMKLIDDLSKMHPQSKYLVKNVNGNLSLMPTYDEIGSLVAAKLNDIAGKTDKNVVAVFHGNLNVTCLKYLGHIKDMFPTGEQFDNCGLAVIERNGSDLKVVSYKPNSEL